MTGDLERLALNRFAILAEIAGEFAGGDLFHGSTFDFT
jgi:hypothetical protein